MLLCVRAALLLWLLAIAFPFYSLINSIIGALTASMVSSPPPLPLLNQCARPCPCLTCTFSPSGVIVVDRVGFKALMIGAGVLHPACIRVQPVLHAQRLQARHGPQAAPQVSQSSCCPHLALHFTAYLHSSTDCHGSFVTSCS